MTNYNYNKSYKASLSINGDDVHIAINGSVFIYPYKKIAWYNKGEKAWDNTIVKIAKANGTVDLVRDHFELWKDMIKRTPKEGAIQLAKNQVHCGRCGGTGNYLHYGTCYSCSGSGVKEIF